ncbi:MAG: DUF2442 domain-containing protein [Verrucomicrobia bacterium]|nr:DUF2442 domain-containing protein [Verrucomicrobiota bacterium]
MLTIEGTRTNIPRVVSIEAAHYVAPYNLNLRFDNGHESAVDFGPFLNGSAHPSIRAYLDVERFKAFSLEQGMLHWNDFDLVFPMADLYAGRIS